MNRCMDFTCNTGYYPQISTQLATLAADCVWSAPYVGIGCIDTLSTYCAPLTICSGRCDPSCIATTRLTAGTPILTSDGDYRLVLEINTH
jgi:hypothetical protein